MDFILDDSVGIPAIDEVTLTHHSSPPPPDVPQTGLDHLYHRASSPPPSTSSRARNRPSSRSQGHSSHVLAMRMIEVQAEMKEMLDRHLGRIADLLSALVENYGRDHA